MNHNNFNKSASFVGMEVHYKYKSCLPLPVSGCHTTDIAHSCLGNQAWPVELASWLIVLMAIRVLYFFSLSLRAANKCDVVIFLKVIGALPGLSGNMD